MSTGACDGTGRRDRGQRERARPRRRRHRPDHPQAVPEAGRAHRLRRVPLLRLDPRRRDRARAEPDPRHGAELRLRIVARARAVGAPGLRLRGDDRAVVRGHLLRQLHQDRAAAGDPRSRPTAGRSPRLARRGSTSTTRRSTRPPASSGSSSTSRSSTGCATASTTSGSRLQSADAIDAFEAAATVSGPDTTQPVTDWDATTYDRVADPQEEWGREVLARLDLARRRDRARRRLRQRPRDPAAARPPAGGPRDRGRRRALDDRQGARGDRRRRAGRAACRRPARPRPGAARSDAIFSNASLPLDPRSRPALRPPVRRAATRWRARGPVRGPGQRRRVEARDRGRRGRRALLAVPARRSQRPTTSPRSATRRRGWSGRASRRSRCGWRAAPSRRPSRRRTCARSASRPTSSGFPTELHDEFVDAVLGSMPRPLVLEYVRLNISATARQPA